MSEHSPSPVPARGVYGFALYLVCTTAFFIYLVWGFVPDSILHSIGITYYPQKYWAVALPVYVLMGIALFAFFVYPSLNQRLALSLDNTHTFTDEYAAMPPSEFPEYGQKPGAIRRIQPAYDLHISQVSRMLYNRTDDAGQ